MELEEKFKCVPNNGHLLSILKVFLDYNLINKKYQPTW